MDKMKGNIRFEFEMCLRIYRMKDFSFPGLSSGNWTHFAWRINSQMMNSLRHVFIFQQSHYWIIMFMWSSCFIIHKEILCETEKKMLKHLKGQNMPLKHSSSRWLNILQHFKKNEILISKGSYNYHYVFRKF